MIEPATIQPQGMLRAQARVAELSAPPSFATALDAHTRIGAHEATPDVTTAGQVTGTEQSGSDFWGRLPDKAQQYRHDLTAAARESDVDPQLLASVVDVESSFRADAVSHAGARGLGQLMPGTAAALGVDPDDPAENLRGAAAYLSEQRESFGNLGLALAAYNAGPAAVREHGGIPPFEETQNYVPRVLDRYRELLGDA